MLENYILQDLELVSASEGCPLRVIMRNEVQDWNKLRELLKSLGFSTEGNDAWHHLGLGREYGMETASFTEGGVCPSTIDYDRGSFMASRGQGRA